MDKKVVLTAAIVVAFLLSSSILVLFYNQTAEDKEINLIARVNTEGSGIYIDDEYQASDFLVVDANGAPVLDSDGNIQYHKEFWEGKIFGTPGSTSIQHIQLKSIVEKSLGYKFLVYTTGANTSPGCNTVYFNDSITNAAAFENSPQLDGGIIWQPQYEALLQSTVRPCNSMMTTADFDPGHTCCVIGASHEFITSNSEVTVRFLAGYIDSVNWINNALKDKSSEEYAQLIQIAMERSGINNRNVIEAALDSVIYTYGGNIAGDTPERPLASLEAAIVDLVDGLGMNNNVLRQGFSSVEEFAQRYVNDGFLAQAMQFEKDPAGYSQATVTVAVIAGDVHQLAIHLGMDLGFFSNYGINISVSNAANGAGVATSLQNGEADFGFVGAPPMTITVINGGLTPS